MELKTEVCFTFFSVDSVRRAWGRAADLGVSLSGVLTLFSAWVCTRFPTPPFLKIQGQIVGGWAASVAGPVTLAASLCMVLFIRISALW